MKLENYVNEIKLKLTGGVLELEIPDTTIAEIVNMALREVQRYIDIPKLVTVPFSSCIDLKDFNHSSIIKVYRTKSYSGDTNAIPDSGMMDPMMAQQWMVFSNGGSMYNLNDYMLNFMSYNTLLQLRNTTSTDLSFKEDKQGNKLYINCSYDKPNMITIEYIPVYNNVEDIEDDYWTDVIMRLSVGLTKQTLGRIRTYATQSSAVWQLDGDKLLEEGNQEVNDIRQSLVNNMTFMYPID